MIIDAHIHVGSWNHGDFLGRSNDLATTLQVLQKSGIDGAVLTSADRHDHQFLLDSMKEALATRFTGPLWLFPWVRSMNAGEAAEQDLQWVSDHAADVSGLKVHPSLSRVRIDDDPFRPILELARSANLVILVHCGRWQEIAGYMHSIEAATRHPDIRFIFAHAGGDTPPFATGAARAVHERKLTNVWFEFSGLREYWVIERNVDLIGADRYLLGSDFPLAHPLMYIGAVQGMNLSPAQRQMILGENAVQLLGSPMNAGGTLQ